MDIKAIQEKLAEFVDQRDREQFHRPKNLAMAFRVGQVQGVAARVSQGNHPGAR